MTSSFFRIMWPRAFCGVYESDEPTCLSQGESTVT